MTESMRDSGEPWLGRIPSHWKVVPAKAVMRVRNEVARPSDTHLTPSQKYGVLPQEEYMEISGSRVVLNLKDSGQMKHVEPGDFVSHLRSFQGGLELVTQPGKVSGAYTVVALLGAQEPRYWKYALKSALYIQALQSTTDQLRDGQSIRMKELALIRLPVPPLDEQKAIANYLDTELRALRGLMEIQGNLQALAEESFRSAQQRLTSDSPEARALGVTHWQQSRVKHVLENRDYLRRPLSAEERALMQGEIPYFGASGVIDFIDRKLISKPMVLVSEDGANLLNRSTPIAFVAEGEYWVNNHAHVMEALDGCPEYWAFAVDALDVAPVVTGSAQPKLTATALASLEVQQPQRVTDRWTLAKELQARRARTDDLLIALQELQKLLEAQVQSMIAAAVTGKIDVRGESRG